MNIVLAGVTIHLNVMLREHVKIVILLRLGGHVPFNYCKYLNPIVARLGGQLFNHYLIVISIKK